jgi:hypothetical protein
MRKNCGMRPLFLRSRWKTEEDVLDGTYRAMLVDYANDLEEHPWMAEVSIQAIHCCNHA